MYILILGILVFFGVHLVPSFVSFRQKVITSIGKSTYQGLYSVTALAGLALIIYGKSIAEFQSVWEPPIWSKNVVIVVMVVAAFFLVAADMKSNTKRFVRHPMLLGVLLWSGAHLFANGDLASILLFGSFFVFSSFGIVSANKRGASNQEKIYPLTKDAVTVLASIAAYLIFIKYLHPYLIGVSII